MSTSVERLAYGYELMHRAICNMAGTSGADGRWYFDRANEVLKRVSPVFSVGPESNPHKPGDCLSGYKSFRPSTTSQYIPPHIGPHDESVAAVVEGERPAYLLIKRGLYYAPNNHGYTGIKERAGRYLASDGNGDDIIAVHEDDAPMFSPKCFDDIKVEHLTRKFADQSALIAQLVELLDAWVTWHTKATADDDCAYLNGKGWSDAEMLANNARTALAAARGEG